MTSALQLHSVRKSFGSTKVLLDVSFTLCTGGVMGLFGSNGSGKSTLLKILFGTLPADALDLSLNGSSLKAETIIPKQIIGYLPQNHFLPKHCKVRDIIPYFYEGGAQQDLIFRAPFLENIARRKIGALSMGEQRYLEVLLIAHLDHPFLLLDEPFSMIEPLYKEKIKELLLSLRQKKGIIITDHYYTDVLAVSTQNLVLTSGISRLVKDVSDLQKEGYIR